MLEKATMEYIVTILGITRVSSRSNKVSMHIVSTVPSTVLYRTGAVPYCTEHRGIGWSDPAVESIG